MAKKRKSQHQSMQTASMQNPAQTFMEARRKLEEAEQLRQARKLDKAQRICEALLKEHDDYTGAMHTLGLIYADKHNYNQALIYLTRASMLNPDDYATLTALSGVYLRLQAPILAARTLEQARALKPDDANILATLGEIYREDREYEAAAQAYRQAIALDNTLFAADMGLGLVCDDMGELEEAAACFIKLLKRGARSIKVIHGLTQLPASFFNSGLLNLIDKAKPDPGEDKASFESALLFTRAPALDKAGRHEEAWHDLLKANAAEHEKLGRKRQEGRAFENMLLDGVRKTPIPTKIEPAPDGETQSLFILGPSRSGKTTVERLLAACDGVKRGYENPIVEHSVGQTFRQAGLPTRVNLIELPPVLDDAWRKLYLADITRRAPDARVFTNTLPGHIHSALRLAVTQPSARFIFVKRNPDDLALRIFMKKYRSTHSYAYDLKEIRDYITWYHAMIDALAERLPETSRVITYEAMIEDPSHLFEAASALCGISQPAGPLPQIGDDRGCAQPYKSLMARPV